MSLMLSYRDQPETEDVTTVLLGRIIDCAHPSGPASSPGVVEAADSEAGVTVGDGGAGMPAGHKPGPAGAAVEFEGAPVNADPGVLFPCRPGVQPKTISAISANCTTTSLVIVFRLISRYHHNKMTFTVAPKFHSETFTHIPSTG